MSALACWVTAPQSQWVPCNAVSLNLDLPDTTCAPVDGATCSSGKVNYLDANILGVIAGTNNSVQVITNADSGGLSGHQWWNSQCLLSISYTWNGVLVTTNKPVQGTIPAGASCGG